MDNRLDIGVSIPVRNSDFMDLIMTSGIADSGVESTGDVFFEYGLENADKMTNAEFDDFLEECGIGAEQFKQW